MTTVVTVLTADLNLHNQLEYKFVYEKRTYF